jgi:exonuclease SbcD
MDLPAGAIRLFTGRLHDKILHWEKRRVANWRSLAATTENHTVVPGAVGMVREKGSPLRVIHTSDWHLGQELHGFDRGVEHDGFLDWLASQVIELDADALIVTGDIYDTVNPPILAQQRLYQFVMRALTTCPHLQIVVIGGNHDSAARLELPKHLLDVNRVHLIGGMPRATSQLSASRLFITLRDHTGAPGAVCAAIPYLRPGDLPLQGDSENPLKSLYRQVIRTADGIRGELPLIVTGHLHVSGGAVSTLSERRIVIGGEEAVSNDIFPASVAYVALGHLHKPQLISGQTIVRYAGSPFPMSVAEADYHHSIVVLDLNGSPAVKTTLLRTPRPIAFYRVPTTGAAPLDTVEDTLRGLRLDDPGEHRRPFLEVAIRLEAAEPDLRRRIDEALEGKPVRLTRVMRQMAGQGGTLADTVEGATTLDMLDPAQVFARRHVEEYGREPPDDLQRAFNDVFNSIGSTRTGQGGVA